MVDIAQTLTRRIGPFPVWGYGVGIGGGILVAQMIRGKSLPSTSQSASTDSAQTEDTDTSSITSQGSSSNPATYSGASIPGPAGPAGKDAPVAAQMPACPNPSWGWDYDPNRNLWKPVFRQKPNDTADKTWEWASAPYCGWVPKAKTASTLPTAPKGSSALKIVTPTPPKIVNDRGAGGVAASSNTHPTIFGDDIGGYTIAPAGTTQMPRSMNIKRNPIPMVPSIAGQRPRNLSRKVGRPYHGI